MAAKTCAFCGSDGKLTAEHVFGDWLGRIGLSAEPVRQESGPLNRSGRRMGVTPPFKWTVRAVCGPCNHGWMSKLEATAARVLAPLVRGLSGLIPEEDQSALAAWAQKTALVGMLTSPGRDRHRGHGLPETEYRDLHARRDRSEPLPESQFWIGRYEGSRLACAWVTPMVVRFDGLPEPELPHAYVMTVLIGAVILQGVRFTRPDLFFDLSPVEDFPQLWPKQGPVSWPMGSVVDDERFLKVSKGLNLRSRTPGLALAPWKPAIELPMSVAVGSLVRLPTMCGRHFVCYPAALVHEAMRGVFYAFVTACECNKAYWVETESDGAHCRDEREGEDGLALLLEAYEALPGMEVLIRGSDGEFVCKRLVRKELGSA